MTAHRKPANDAAVNFARRHIGPSPRDIAAMLESVGAKSLEALMAETLPASIRQKAPLDFGAALSETEALGYWLGTDKESFVAEADGVVRTRQP